jgi:GntR family transcriptional regulator
VPQQPKYLWIADNLRERIELGAALPPESDDSADVEPDAQLPAALRPGSRLPTELGLSAEYSASRNTIRDAIKRLAGLGLVEARQGQGTFVTLRVEPFVTVLTGDPKSGNGGDEGASYLSQVSAEHRTPLETQPKVELQIPDAEITRRLRVPRRTQVVSRHQQRYIDGVPWSLQTSYYPMDFIDRGATGLLRAEDIEGGTVRYLADTIKLTQLNYRDWITARRPDVNEQAFFGLAHDGMVFEVFRTAFDQDKKPMRVTVTIFPTDRNQFIVDVGDGLPPPQYGDDESQL